MRHPLTSKSANIMNTTIKRKQSFFKLNELKIQTKGKSFEMQFSLSHQTIDKNYNQHRIFSLLVFLLLNTLIGFAQLPLNPFAPNSSWPEGHGTYCQQNSPITSLTEADSIVIDSLSFISDHSGYYPTGTATTSLYPSSSVYCFWGCNGKAMYKVVCDINSTQIISKKSVDLGGNNFASGYWSMDLNNQGYFLSDYKLILASDSVAGNPYSGIKQDTIVDLSAYQVSSGDGLYGIKMLYSGELVLTSSEGNIFVIDRNSLAILFQDSIGQTITNNMAVDEGNNVFINTDSTNTKYHWNGSTLTAVWSMSLGKSGSTPTLIGTTTAPDEEQLVAVTDRSNPMNLILIYKNNIPSGWTGIPGYPLRVAAVQPITFNTPFPALNVSPTQNSLMVKDSSILFVRWDGLFPTASSFKPGMEKWTWHPSNNTLSQDWVNDSIYIPNSMQALSNPSNYFYAIGETQILANKYWTLKAIDWSTGQQKIEEILGPHTDSRLNTNGSGIQIGPYGEVITMSPKMIFRFRKYSATTGFGAINSDRDPLTIYPNPSNTVIIVECKKGYHIYSSTGQLVKLSSQPTNQINIADLPTGIYFIKVENQVQKFIKTE
jgi:hypothetical protein